MNFIYMNYSSIFTAVGFLLLSLSLSLVAQSARAEAFNAGKVMAEMKAPERYAVFSGIVEGLAIARYYKDAKKNEGMGCIYDWFYKDKQSLTAILDAFQKYPSYPPGSIIDAMVKRKCGE